MDTAQAEQAFPLNQQEALRPATFREQTLRKRRLAMSFTSYIATFSLVAFCWYQDLIPGQVVVQYAVFSALLNGTFLCLIQTNLNLRFRDPSMTIPQMVLSLLPALWVMFFLDSGQARASFLMIAMVPPLYGMLGLSRRQFLMVSLTFFGLYGLLYLSLLAFRPEALTGALDLIQTLAFALVMSQIAIIGGFISELRSKLRERNKDLGEAMAKIQDLVNMDALTGIYNRRRLFEVIAEESNRYGRCPGSFSLCLLDIDHFKDVNDTHGHQAGDAILRSVAQCVAKGLRVIDCFGRYGGEEFLIILPQTPIEGALIKAERVRECIEGISFDDISGSLRVTVSIGVAEFQRGEDPDQTLARADQALYEAKHKGRNQVVTHDSHGELAVAGEEVAG
ncbi:GGDEF domain-containing protein [Marinobacter sp.]|uniref:GGDEF domain-containing protein n=1 Tax=Marinobacter sp. TaxID=50741 RepID=UPI0038503078